MNNFKWNIDKTSKLTRARVGTLSTPHGEIKTPAFIFCGTKASLKSFSTTDAKKNKTQIILSNTYHLMLQPGSKIIAQHGGLHNFMNWNGPMLTDSGGFQIFSLGHGSVADEIKGRAKSNNKKKSLLQISEEGALFKSYLWTRLNPITKNKMELKKELKIPKKNIIFGSIGRFHPQKGFDLILKKFKQESPKNSTLLLIGNGHEEFNNKVRNYENIILLGHINNVSNYYNLFDVLKFNTNLFQ